MLQLLHKASNRNYHLVYSNPLKMKQHSDLINHRIIIKIANIDLDGVEIDSQRLMQ